MIKYLLIFALIGLISCSSAPRSYVKSRDTETKTSTIYEYDLDVIGQKSTNDNGSKRYHHDAEYEGQNAALIQFIPSCNKWKITKTRSITRYSTGRTKYGSWKEDNKERLGNCATNLNDISFDYSKDMLKLLDKGPQSVEVLSLSNMGSSDGPLTYSYGRIPGQVQFKEPLQLQSRAVIIFPVDKTKSLGNIDTSSILINNLDQPKSVYSEFKATYKGKSVVTTVALKDINNVINNVINHVERKHFKYINISTLDIDSHYPFSGSKITISGRSPSPRDILSRYIKDKDLLNSAISKVNWNYMSGNHCCGNRAKVFYPASYSVKVIHPKYHHTSKKIRVTNTNSDFEFYMSELGTKHRVKIVDY